MVVEVVNLFLTSKLLVAGESDNLDARSHHEECHIETYLVVARTSTSVSNSVGANLFSIASYGNSLEYTLRRYGDRVAVVAQYITENHIFQ